MNHLVGTFAFLLAGAWAIYTWVHSDDLRRQREIPSIEMTTSVEEKSLPNGLVFLEINFCTRNSGVVPILVDLTRSKIEIEVRPVPQQVGVEVKKLDEYRVESRPLENDQVKELTLEPMTNTIITEYYTATRCRLYALRLHLHFKGQEWFWERTQLHYLE